MTDLDLLGCGSPHWNSADVLSAITPGSINGVGAFWKGWDHAFGDPRSFLGRCINQKQIKLIRIQLKYSKAHDLTPIPYLQQHLPEVQQFAVNHPAAKVWISPSTEYSSNNMTALQQVADMVHHLAPACGLVMNPNTGFPAIPGLPSEHHGPGFSAGSDGFASLDGFSAADGNVENWLAKQSGPFKALWTEELNMNVAGGTQEPDLRTHSPTADLIRSLIRLGSPKGIEPQHTFVGNPIPFDKINLYKSHAENNGVDIRGNHPCIIITEKATHLDIVDCHGNLIEQAPWYSDFEAAPEAPKQKRERYYATEYGFKIGQKALKSSESEFVYFRVNGKYFGGCNPAFRDGGFLW